MSEASDQERTEAASPRRLARAREEGQVPQSRELVTFLVLVAGLGGLGAMAGWLGSRSLSGFRSGLALDRRAAFEPDFLVYALGQVFAEALITLAPILGFTVLAALIGPLLVGGWNFAPKAMVPQWSRIDPVAGLKRQFSLHAAVELVKAMLKALVIGLAAVWVFVHEWPGLAGLLFEPLPRALTHFSDSLLRSAFLIMAGMAAVVAIDVPFQLWQYHARLRMTKEELRQEGREQEGNPEVKARIRRQQQQIARRRMMSEVPKASVVVTNPTHFSVALRYDPDQDDAPRVLAKGRGRVALRIRELAAEHQIPMLEAPPLARALYRHADLDALVPNALYRAVAEVLAYVFQMNEARAQGRSLPPTPTTFSVPPELDPGAA